MAHIGVIPEGMQTNHKDENKVNNRIDNLEIKTNKENCSYGYLLMWYQNLYFLKPCK